MRRLLLLLLLGVPLRIALADALWQTLPPTPPPVAGEHRRTPRSTGSASTMRRSATVRRWCCCTAASPTPTIGGIRSPHGATPHGDLVDSRGHGRSTRDARPYGYDLMADDWWRCSTPARSTRPTWWAGATAAIIGIDLAIRHPDRVGRIFAFAANT